jgi:tRNA(Ile)-lysidine synthetase-like protein
MYSEKYSSVLQVHSKRPEYRKFENGNKLSINFSELEFNESVYCISLSGGVDSMVLLDILHKREKQIIAIHVNYNNREESKLEENFLREYCQEREITFICLSFDITRGSIKRSEYETMTKKVKFEFYRKIMNDYGLDCILLAHHKDDIIENIFTNFCRGENFLNLSVIKEHNTILGVNIHRPLIKHYKQDIYDYAHFHDVPYFLDTTPDWSVRGKFRNKILNLLFDTFSGQNGLKNNLLSIAKESDEWGSLIQDKIINKYFESVKYFNDNEKGKVVIEMPIIIDKEDYSNYPMCFWSEIIAKVFHKYQMSAPSRKSLELFVGGLRTARTARTARTETKVLLKHGSQLIINHKKNSIQIVIN